MHSRGLSFILHSVVKDGFHGGVFGKFTPSAVYGPRVDKQYRVDLPT